METFSEQRIKHILSSSPSVLYTCSLDGAYDLTFVSENVLAFSGYTAEECVGKENFWREIIHPGDHDHVFNGCDDFFASGHESHEYRFLKKDGSYSWVQDEMRLVTDAEGVPLEIVGSWLDISERRQAEEALRSSESLFQTLFESNPIPTIMTSPAGSVYMVNPSFTETTGYSHKEVVGKTSQELGFWRDPSDRERMVSAIHKTGAIENLEAQFFGKNNKPMTCIVSSRAIEHGGEIRMLSTVIDVTEQRKAEEEQRKSEQLLRALFQINPVSTIVTSPEGIVHLVNPVFVKYSGYTMEEVVGKSVHDLGFWKNPDDRQRMLAAIQEHGFIDNLEVVMYGKDEKQMTCLVSSRAVELDGEPRILNVVLDVTEQKAAEESARKLEKAKSDFISTVAHELRTPLIAIIGYCELLENTAGMSVAESQKEEFLGIIQSNAEVLNRLVDDLLDLGRIQIGRPLGITLEEHDLGEILTKVVASLKVRTGRHEIVVEQSQGVPPLVRVDAGRIAQVLYNLLSNAIKYSPEGGVIKVCLGCQDNRITMAVIDQGLGMTPEQVEQVFDQFYRADDDNSETLGLGLGMSIVRQIVSDHGGTITVDSHPGEGSTVTVSLPLQ